MQQVTRAEAVAFRCAAHHLTERLDPARLPDAAGACGVRNSPPGSALVSLHARVRDVTPATVDAALADDRTLLQTWSLRGAPFVFPTADAATFTAGVLPTTEAGRRHLIPGVGWALDRLGMSLAEAVALCEAEIDVLAGRRLDVTELGVAIAPRVAARLPAERRTLWEEEGPYAADQPLGEAVVHFCLRLLTLRGVLCFAPREGNRAPFVLVSEWLGPRPAPDPDAARADLLRRFLHCYGPATKAGFAAWLGVRVGDVAPWWEPLADELTAVDFDGRAWLLTADLDALGAGAPAGVRLLPPRDPYTQLRDRATILYPAHHKGVWRAIGEPGSVLVRGTIAGTWRPRKSGRRLTITITPFGPLADPDRRAVQDEAEQLGPLRGAAAVDVNFEE